MCPAGSSICFVNDTAIDLRKKYVCDLLFSSYINYKIEYDVTDIDGSITYVRCL